MNSPLDKHWRLRAHDQYVTFFLTFGIFGFLLIYFFLIFSAIIENALLHTLETGVHTGDFGDKTKPSVNTTQFADAIISNFGKKPEVGAREIIANKPGTPTPLKLETNPMMISKEGEAERIVGVDLFIESEEQPTIIAEK
jgi:isocitrate dehydrogenase